MQNEPVFEKRPVERWKNPVLRHRALDKLNEKKISKPNQNETQELDLPIDPDPQMSVGVTALCAAILKKNGMIDHVGNALNHNPKLTMNCLNLAMHAAITTDKTYLADQEPTQQKFIGYGCLSSPRASELF